MRKYVKSYQSFKTINENADVPMKHIRNIKSLYGNMPTEENLAAYYVDNFKEITGLPIDEISDDIEEDMLDIIEFGKFHYLNKEKFLDALDALI